MRILSSARKHGVADDDIWHALRNQTGRFVGRNEILVVVGPARDGTLLEVGIVEESGDDPRIIHAMKARTQYLPGGGTKR